MISFAARLQDAKDASFKRSLLFWLQQTDPNGDYEDATIFELLTSALSILADNEAAEWTGEDDESWDFSDDHPSLSAAERNPSL